MRKVSHQGMQLSASQRRRLALDKLVKPAAYRVADAQALNDRFPMFVGPYPVDLDYDSHRYWAMVDSIKRYGRDVPEESFRGAPFCGDRTPLQQEQTL